MSQNIDKLLSGNSLSKSAKSSLKKNASNTSSEDDPWAVSKGPETPMSSQKKLKLGKSLSSSSGNCPLKKKSSRLLSNKSVNRVVGAASIIEEEKSEDYDLDN